MKRAAIILCILASLAFQTTKKEVEPCYCVGSISEGVGYGDPVTNKSEPSTCKSGVHVAYKASELDKRAVITAKPEPGYTQEAKDNHTSGVVRLRAVLCPSGKVFNISVVKGLPDGLTEKAIIAAKGIKFNPAEKDSRKVAQFVTLEYYFEPL
jgi:TonB family protein